MFDFEKFLNKDGQAIAETIKGLMPAFAEAMAIINPPKPKTVAWRKKEITTAHPVGERRTENNNTVTVVTIYESKIVEIEYAMKEISDYMVCLVKADNVVGISYCHADDRAPHFNPEKSLKLAYDRRKIKQNKGTEIFEEYIEAEFLYFADSKCPHKLVKAVNRKMNSNSIPFNL